MQEQEIPGECCEGARGLGWVVPCKFQVVTFLILLAKQLSSNIDSNRIGGWNSGTQQQSSALSAAGSMWPWTNSTIDFTELIETVETGGLNQLDNDRESGGVATV